jgi:uncharacterized membrane protein YgcG
VGGADLPSPQADPAGVCGRGGRKSAVCDPDGVLPRGAADVVDGVANFVAEGSHGFAKMDCAGRQTGYQVAVAVLRRMKDDGRAQDERVAHFARELHDSWAVGDAACNNGVVLVVALDDRKMFISTGAGAKAALSDRAVQAVLSDMKAALRADRVDLAVQTGVADIGKVLAGATNVGGQSLGSETSFLDVAVVSLFALVLFSGVCMRPSSTGPTMRYRSCQAALRRLEADRALARQNVFQGQTSCPICLEEFEKRSPPPSPAPLVAGSPPPPGVRQRAAAAAAAAAAAVDADGAGAESSAPLLPPSAGAAAAAAPMSAADLPESEQALRCGHKFHKDCLRRMVQNSTSSDSCPVCRRPMFGPERPPPPRPDQRGDDAAGSSSSSAPPGDVDIDLPSGRVHQRANGGDWDAFYPEYVFRLRRMNHLYPRYVTADMVTRWGDENHDQPLAADVHFRALEPPVAQEARLSGSGGSSFSFGGGGSGGGGGGGSSW